MAVCFSCAVSILGVNVLNFKCNVGFFYSRKMGLNVFENFSNDYIQQIELLN